MEEITCVLCLGDAGNNVCAMFRWWRKWRQHDPSCWCRGGHSWQGKYWFVCFSKYVSIKRDTNQNYKKKILEVCFVHVYSQVLFCAEEAWLWVVCYVPQLKPWGSPSVGWDGRVCSHFLTPVHIVMHTAAVSPAVWQLHCNVRDFNNGACRVLEITVA